MLKMISADSITEAAYRRIRGDLLSCRLAPGEKLRINKLQEELQISLGAVREALARLTSEGLVVAEPQKGFRAAPVSVSDLADLTDARVEIEALCLRRSLALGDVEWETRLVAANHRLSRIPLRNSRDANRYNEEWNIAHDEFHGSLVAACDNHTLLLVREQLFTKSARYRWFSVSMTSIARDVGQEHQSLVDAALERNAARAELLLTGHLRETTRILTEALKMAAGGRSAVLGARRSKERRRA